MLINFQRYSSIKIGAEVEATVIADRGFDPSGFFVAGNACNLLVSPNPPPIAVLDRSFDYLRVEGDVLIAGG
ncbi:MAG: UDP-N-acetylmuramate dehydrogenase, partial [Helicobacteraceae bacterium]|nr:UDP-N-acetylmuramate dehydrogenase [Helicobacteraceae bacterium]